MASKQSHLAEDEETAEARRSLDEDQFRKVFDRSYAAPSLSAHRVAGNEDDTPQTSHLDYNFDEKDYKSRRKTSTKYHEPLRRISSHYGDLSSHDKKSLKRHKKKHKKDHSREARLHELVHHEGEKAKSREMPAQRRKGTIVSPEEGYIKEPESPTPTKDEREIVPPLAIWEDDSVEVFDGMPSPIPKDLTEITPTQVSEEKKDLISEHEKKALVSISTEGVEEEDTPSHVIQIEPDDDHSKEQPKHEEEDDDDEVGIQMRGIKENEDVTCKQSRKYSPKERDSFVDILPKIKEHDDEHSNDSIKFEVTQHDATDGEKVFEEEQAIESHHMDRLVPRHHVTDKRSHKHHRHHHRKHEVNQHRTIGEREALVDKARLRSGLLTLQETEPEIKPMTEEDEEANLEKKDLEEMAWHRFEDLRGLRRRRPHHHKPRLKSGMLTRRGSTDTLAASVHVFPVKYDHSPHEPFIELQELTEKGNSVVWKETARWIKFEEDVETSNRWGKPHVASLTFHSLLELRRGLEKGTVLLDLEQFDLPSIVDTIVENMIITDQITRADKEIVVDALMLKHRHQYQEESTIQRRPSLYSLISFAQNVTKEEETMYPAESDAEDVPITMKIDENLSDCSVNIGESYKVQEPLVKRDVTFAPAAQVGDKGTPRKNESNVKSRIPPDAEATAVMVGALKSLRSPVLAFVRIAKGCYLGNLTEVDIPVRFIFIMLGPSDKEDTYYEIGRSISTLMSDQVFHDLAYYSETREDILLAINEFLDDTVVLPPGEWDRQLLIPLLMGQSKVMAKRRKEAKQISAIAVAAAEEEDGPLQRTGRYAGGLIRDIKRRSECYISDFKDGLNLQTLWVTLFLYFSVFAPNIAFGGLLAEKTDQWLGISEVIFGTCLCGIIFGLFAGQPLIIIGATGPVLVFEQSIYQFCQNYSIEFLPWRFWIGLWVMLILLVVVVFEGCFLVRYFTRFTEEVFGCLISAIFIYEAIHFLSKVFKWNPLSRFDGVINVTSINEHGVIYSVVGEPNTALLSVILLFGTFFIAFYMQKVRHSHFFGKQLRRLISDLGIIIAMVTMVVLDAAVGEQVVTPKVSFANPFKDGFRPTLSDKRGWIINPIGLEESIKPGWVFAAIVPAMFVGILLFMETELTGVLLNKKENNLQKLPGFNIDLLLMGILTFICGIFGLPWMCAATVRSISHFSALSVWSTSHAPGERPFLIEVKEQRLSNIGIHVLTGFSILLAPALYSIPVPVLFGVLLYLGVASLSHIQLVNRMVMLFMPVKHHPDVRYVRKVQTKKIYWFTFIQIFCLIILVIVKLSDAAPSFPFFIICLIPLRRLLTKFFTEEELEELDNEEGDGDDSDFDDLDLAMHR